MLKLNSVNGKFDIVFSNDPFVDGKHSKKLVGLASRSFPRANKHLKSSCETPRPKVKKVTPTKSNKDGRVTKSLPQEKKTLTPRKKTISRTSDADQNHVGKSTNQNRKCKKGEVSSNLKGATNKEDTLNVNINELSSDVNKEGDAKEVTKKNIVSISSDKVNENILSEVQVDNNSEMARREMYDFGNTGMSNNEPDGFISRQNLNNMFRGFFEEGNAVNIVEPPNVPGLNFSAINSNKLKEIESSPLNSTKKDNVTPPYQLNMNNRDNMIRNYQSTMAVQEEYYPWGRPGCGAPLKDKDENIIADLKSYKSGLRRTRSSDAAPNNARFNNINSHNPNNVNNENTLQELVNTNNVNQQYSNSANSHGATFARGQCKSQFELENIQKRKQKELEHQNAIRQQVEEKRRLKQMEKERELAEEREAESRYLQQQARINEMAEKEKKKQHEKEEKIRKQKELLEENIRKANLEAKKAKESKHHTEDKQREHLDRNAAARRNNTKYHSHNNENNTETNQSYIQRRLHNNTHNYNESDTEANQNYIQRRLHHDDSPISTVQGKYKMNKLPTESQDFNFVNTVKNGNNDQYASTEIDSGRGNQTFTHSPRNEYIPNYTNNENNIRNNKHISKHSVSSPDLDTGRNSRSLYEKLYGKELDSSVNVSHERNNVSMRRKSLKPKEKLNKSIDSSRHDDTFEKIFNDYLIPFHRTETTGLIDNPKPILTSEVKKPVMEKEESKKNPDTDRRSSPHVSEHRVSARQQQILNQLHALREGLMRKEREYVLEKFS